MPPKKKIPLKQTGEATTVPTAEQTLEPIVTTDKNPAETSKAFEIVEQTNCQSPQNCLAEPSTKVSPSAKPEVEASQSTIICFDSINHKTEEQRLEEQRIKFATKGQEQASEFSQKTENSNQQLTQEIEKSAVFELLLKDLSAEEKLTIKNRMNKFGLSQQELKDILKQLKVTKDSQRMHVKNDVFKDKKKEQHREERKQEKLHKRFEPKKSDREESWWKSKLQDNRRSRSRDDKPPRHRPDHSSSKNHRRFRH